ncbi:PREDICTED: death-inducer obliterator 1-like [Nicrophorus vespilloides]|uniref:Death-inducer obliterator 1-like n=1 Tax=Nicrophorus vespilloides TaxID=110193 RepID=A0ABM1MML6_NICVS|nr:PREDICTED: death-inducer obliterator 1-like [Nicrophorus vespilloides]
MSSSTFNVTEPDSSDSLTLIVSPNGTVTPDKETVRKYLSTRPSVDINVMRMKKIEAGAVNVTLDSLTYINSDEIEDQEEMDEIARNLLNLKRDHDYTPLTSPIHQKSDDPAEDELAQTLSMLEGGNLMRQEPLTKITKIVKGKKQTIFVNSKQKARMISTGLLKEKPSERLFKKPKPKVIEIVQKKEEIVEPKEEPEDSSTYSDEDDIAQENDDNDSDFELEDDYKPLKPKPRTRTRSELNKKRFKQIKVNKDKIEPEIHKTNDESTEKLVPEPKPTDKKITPKKEKKVPKPLPDDFALFSTPDIIRRVKEPESPEKLTPPKPAKVQPPKILNSELRMNRNSTENQRRPSIDSKPRPDIVSVPNIVTNKMEDQVTVQEVLNTSNESIPEDQLQPIPSAEDIRAIIQNENTKSFTTSLVIPDIAPNSADDQNVNNMNLDSGGLELDQSLLDNISSDMISEDILYQVAQSLVGNTELQNVIDKSISEGNLVLDSSMQNDTLTLPEEVQHPQLPDNLNHQQVPTVTNVVQTNHLEENQKSGTQIVRPDGRVVIIPPIERPTTRSRNKKKDQSPVRQLKPVKKPLDEEHVSGNELDSEDDEEESEDDPNKLWCICNQPHNNRFMICCDTCEEWYHGKCVNVTKAMGQMMEQEGKEWICVYCKDTALSRPNAAARRIRKASRTSTDSGGGGNSLSTPKRSPFPVTPSSSSSSEFFTNADEKKASGPSQPGCVVCGKPCRNSSIYCSDTCILKHAQGVEKVVVFDRKSGKLLSGTNAPSAANLDKWLSENPSYEVVRSAVKQGPPKPATFTQSKLRLVKNTSNEGVSLAIHKKGVNIGVLQHSPKEPQEILNSKQTPKKPGLNITGLKIISKQVTVGAIQSKIKVVPASPITTRPALTSTPAKIKMVQTKLPMTPLIVKSDKLQPMPQKTPKARQAEVPTPPKQENLRETVKKTFFEQLSNRLKKVADLKLTDIELKGISNEIESQLYKCFGDTGQKYKNKYRSLIFNIKDPKNQTLWRRICEKSVNPYQLVRLSPDDLASQELALWREREAKHQLDMIKKSEMELLNCSRQYVFKTHKGEQVFEDDNRNKDQVTEVISGLGNENSEKEEAVGDNGKDKKNALSKHNKKDKERGRSRERSKTRRDSKERHKDSRSSSKKRSRSKDRSSTRHSERKRSRSRDRHRRSSHRSSRHSKKEEKSINTEKLDKKSKEILEQLVDKNIVPPLEDRLWKHVPQEDIVPTPTIESDSDHEPSSTVTIPTPPRTTEQDEITESIKSTDDEIKIEEKPEDEGEPQTGKSPDDKFTSSPLWTGTINMIDVAQISITAHEVSGDCNGLGDELLRSLDIVGRISPETVWDYIGKMKSSNSKTISVIRLVATNMEERMPYLALYTYLSSRNRLGVVKTITKAVKDFYILPLAGSTPIPEPLLPITGPGFEESRPALLLGILVRDKRKRMHDGSHHGHSKRVRVDIASHSQQPSTPPSSSRSYTPPPTRQDPRVKIPATSLPVPPPLPIESQDDDMDEPYSPEDSDPDTLPEQPLANSRLNTNDITSLLTGPVKSSSFLESGLTAQTFEPFSNKFDSIPGLDDSPSLSTSSVELQRKMAELDQRIAAQKAEIDKVSQDLVSSATSADIGSSTLANIALPSNLQQILESIKTIGSKTDGNESQSENSNSSTVGASSDLTIPLLLPKLSSRPLTGSASSKLDATIPLNLPKTKIKGSDSEKPSSVLSTLSEEELIKKAAEMLGEDAEVPTKKSRIDLSQPPIPGLD